MADGIDVRVVDRPQHPVGRLGRVLTQGDVGAGDHPVQLGEHLVLIIESAVAEDVALRAGEEHDAFHLVVRIANGGGVFEEAIGVEAVGLDLALGVVRDREERVAERLCGLGHLDDAGGAVAGGGVRVQVALHVARLNERRQLVFLGDVDLAAIFAQLRGDPRQAEPLENLFLRRRRGGLDRRDAAGLTRLLMFLPSGLLEDAPVVERVPAIDGQLAEVLVVLLAAGEVHEGRPEVCVGHDAAVALQAVLGDDAALGIALDENAIDLVKVCEGVERFSGFVGDDQEVEIADRLLAPPKAAGGLDARDARQVAESRDDGLDHLRRRPDAATLVAAGEQVDAVLDLGELLRRRAP